MKKFNWKKSAATLMCMVCVLPCSAAGVNTDAAITAGAGSFADPALSGGQKNKPIPFKVSALLLSGLILFRKGDKSSGSLLSLF